MQTSQTVQNREETEPWRTGTPYSDMLADYQRASEKLLVRIAELRAELKQMQAHKAGSLTSAKAQLLLEQRIQMLKSEYEDVREVMRAVRIYAEREVQR
ncbi:MAG: hypothetical protein IJ060_07075 [Oscillospiraceae bacterium]|nr:hypothetical protein [Oscillospiraceae bacterium]